MNMLLPSLSLLFWLFASLAELTTARVRPVKLRSYDVLLNGVPIKVRGQGKWNIKGGRKSVDIHLVIENPPLTTPAGTTTSVSPTSQSASSSSGPNTPAVAPTSSPTAFSPTSPGNGGQGTTLATTSGTPSVRTTPSPETSGPTSPSMSSSNPSSLPRTGPSTGSQGSTLRPISGSPSAKSTKSSVTSGPTQPTSGTPSVKPTSSPVTSGPTKPTSGTPSVKSTSSPVTSGPTKPTSGTPSVKSTSSPVTSGPTKPASGTPSVKSTSSPVTSGPTKPTSGSPSAKSTKSPVTSGPTKPTSGTPSVKSTSSPVTSGPTSPSVTPLSLPTGSPTPGNTVEETEALEAHNKFRAVHNSPSMILNREMSDAAAAYAQQIAASGNFTHSPKSQRPDQGENLSMGCSTNKAQSVTEAVANWYNEVCNPGYRFGVDGNQRGTGHFTQVVWKESTELGIGRAEATRDGMKCAYIVGRYKPAGNVIQAGGNQYVRNVEKGSFHKIKYCSTIKTVGLIEDKPQNRRIIHKHYG